jgi:hypothetical protein
MTRTLIVAAFCGICFSPVLRGEEPHSVVFIDRTTPAPAPSGNARIDFGGSMEFDRFVPADQEGTLDFASRKKSPWLAGGLSLALPGAGEFYAERYWKSAAFLAVEVGVWVVAYLYDRKGDRQTDYFQGYANEHWSVVRYAQYAQDHLNPSGKPYNWLLPGTEGRNPWERVNWAEVNRMERDIAGYYSHTLPRYGEQQYFELIGKYPQFNQGWDDAPASFNYGDPLTSRFLYYADERGKANRFYETATTMVTIAIVNHVVSAIDAAFSAGSYNAGLRADVGMKTLPTDQGMRDVPVVSLRYGF